MHEWTVMNGIARSTFMNPLEALYDRVAAVRMLAGDVPVEGRIVFTERSRFPKGRPPKVTQLSALEAEYPALGPESVSAVQERYRQAWDEISKLSEPSPLARR
jgi:hypothetical protein